jgi:hypothetical protein
MGITQCQEKSLSIYKRIGVCPSVQYPIGWKTRSDILLAGTQSDILLAGIQQFYLNNSV